MEIEQNSFLKAEFCMSNFFVSDSFMVSKEGFFQFFVFLMTRNDFLFCLDERVFYFADR